MSNPYLGIFLCFAERFSHRRTLVAGIHLWADRWWMPEGLFPANKRSDASDLARYAKKTESLVRHRYGRRWSSCWSSDEGV